MDTRIFSLVSSEELQAALDNELFRGVLDAMRSGVQILKAVRNKKNGITDFIYLFVNKAAISFLEKEMSDKKFLAHFPGSNKDRVFEKLVTVVNTNTTEDVVYHHSQNGQEKWVHYTIVKLGDGVMITHEDITVEKLAERQLKESETFKTLVADNAPAIIYITDLQNRSIIYINAKVKEVLGITPAEVYQKGFDIFPDLTHPADYLRRMRQLNRLQKGETDATNAAELRLKIKDGTFRWFSVRDRIFKRNEKGEPVQSIGVATDIHKEKLALVQSEQEKRRLKEAESIGHIGSFEWHAETDTFYWSDEMYRIHGVPKGETITVEKLFSSIHPDDLEDVKEKTFRCRRDACTINITHRWLRPDGEIRILSRKLQSFTDKTGNVTHLTGSVRDITAEKNAQEEILRLKEEVAKKATDKYYSIFNSIEEGFCIFEILYDEAGKATDWRFVEVNPAFEHQTGLKNVIGKTGKELTPNAGEPYWFELYDKVVQTGEPVHFENYHEGTQRWYHVHASRVDNADNRLVATVFEDITERKRREQQQEYLLKLNDALRSLADPVIIQQTAMKLIGEHLGAHRAFYGDMLDDEDTLLIGPGYADTVFPLEGYVRFSEFDSDMVTYYRKGQTVIINDIATAIDVINSEHTRTAMEAIQVIAAVGVPLLKAGKVTGILSIHQSHPRKWTPAEITLMEETAERTWAAVERAKAEEALRESEAKLRRALEIETVGVIYFKADGSITYANDAFLRMSGYLREDLKSGLLRWDVMTPPEYMQVSLKALDEYLDQGRTTPYEKEYMRKDGSRWWALFAATRLNDEEGVEFITDITENKKAEQTLAADLAGMRRLYELYTKLVTETNLKTALKEIVTVSADFLETDRGCIQPVSEDGERLEMYAYIGYTENNLFIQHFLHEGSKPACDAARRNQSRLIIEDVETFTPLLGTADREIALKEDIRATQSTPLINRQGELVGVLSNQFHQPYKPTVEQLKLIDLLAWMAANLIERHQTIEALQLNEEQLRQLNTSLEQQITERTADLLKQHNLLKQAEELADAGSWEYDLATKKFIWSEGMYRLFEMTKHIPVSPEIYTDRAIASDKSIAAGIVNMLRKEPQPFEETLRIKPNGIIKTLKIKGTVVYDETAKPLKILGVDMDITTIKEAEARITELNSTLTIKNRQLETLNSEIKTFNTIALNDYQEALRQMYTNLEYVIAHEARNLTNTGKANIRRIQTAIQRMKLRTNDIIAFSRVNALEEGIRMTDLNEALKNAITDLAGKIEETEAKTESEILPSIEGYPLLLSLLFFHLLDNAIKFRKEDEPPDIHISYLKVKGSLLGHAHAENIWYHQVSVTDNGIGFELADAEKIFDMFYRLYDKNKERGLGVTRHKGSGIGLAICKKIMDLHDGFITADGEPDGGAAFHCFFPAALQDI